MILVDAFIDTLVSWIWPLVKIKIKNNCCCCSVDSACPAFVGHSVLQTAQPIFARRLVCFAATSNENNISFKKQNSVHSFIGNVSSRAPCPNSRHQAPVPNLGLCL